MTRSGWTWDVGVMTLVEYWAEGSRDAELLGALSDAVMESDQEGLVSWWASCRGMVAHDLDDGAGLTPTIARCVRMGLPEGPARCPAGEDWTESVMGDDEVHGLVSDERAVAA